MNDVPAIPAVLDRRSWRDGKPPEGLPALLSRAGQRLLDARTSAEVMEAKKLAEAALHYAKVTQAANDTHADCLRIITRAEMRMADEIDRGQAIKVTTAYRDWLLEMSKLDGPELLRRFGKETQ